MFDSDAWLERHGQDKTRPILDSVIAALKENGNTGYAAAGYCFGGLLFDYHSLARNPWDVILDRTLRL